MSSVKKSIAERARHQRQYDKRVNERHMQTNDGKVDLSKALDVGLAVTKSSGTKSGKHDTRSRSRNDTHTNIRPVNDQEPLVEKALNLLNKGLLVQREAMEAAKRRRSMLDYRSQQLSKGSSEGSGIIPEVGPYKTEGSCKDGDRCNTLKLGRSRIWISGACYFNDQ
uniref:Uncharacterized protein n=1 Tax=Tanacetum cinerariifolium TaxID=118510 RepID=A0A6L2M5W0_TANCI|nr:hypothetical protein [Tanacetum cinerariifolium]